MGGSGARAQRGPSARPGRRSGEEWSGGSLSPHFLRGEEGAFYPRGARIGLPSPLGTRSHRPTPLPFFSDVQARGPVSFCPRGRRHPDLAAAKIVAVLTRAAQVTAAGGAHVAAPLRGRRHPLPLVDLKSSTISPVSGSSPQPPETPQGLAQPSWGRARDRLAAGSPPSGRGASSFLFLFLLLILPPPILLLRRSRSCGSIGCAAPERAARSLPTRFGAVCLRWASRSVDRWGAASLACLLDYGARPP